MDKYKLTFGDALLVDFEPLLWYLFTLKQKAFVLGNMNRYKNLEVASTQVLKPVRGSKLDLVVIEDIFALELKMPTEFAGLSLYQLNSNFRTFLSQDRISVNSLESHILAGHDQ